MKSKIKLYIYENEIVMIKEIWKPVVGYEGFYEVSNYGRVKSIYREYIGGCGSICHTGGKYMKIFINKKKGNRRLVALCKDGKKTRYYVSVLVAKAFVPNPESKPEVDHIIPIRNGGGDEAWNLRWVTRKENMNNGLTKFNIKEKSHKKRVCQYTKDGDFVNEFESQIEASRITGVSRSAIQNCCNNKPRYKTAGGYIWKYAA